MTTHTPRLAPPTLRSPRVRALAAIALATAAVAGCSSDPSRAAPEGTGTEGQDLYGLGSLATPWPSGQVPVCYQSPSDHPELQALIPNILFDSWGRAANVNFTGFGACPSSGNRVTIVFSRTPGFRGSTDNLGYGNRTVTLVSDETVPNRPHFTSELIHEFGHALGFAHEMKRPDNWNGGVANQCGDAPTDSDYGQYAPAPGGLYLTANYDPRSIMNYCGPNGSQLSVGDVLAASSPSAYGPENGCMFRSGATACTWTTGLHAESTFTVPTMCPTPNDAWVLQSLSSGGWSNVSNSCPSGQQVGTCGAGTSSTAFTFGSQAEGGVIAGPAIGSVQTVRMCDPFNNCTPAFTLSITDCQTKADQLYLSPGNDPLEVQQEGTGVANILMYGPWVQTDGGLNANAAVVSNPIPGASIWLSKGSTINGAGAIEMMVTVPLWTPVGTYTVRVQATDQGTHVTRTADLAVRVDACTPSKASDQCGGIFAQGCGVRSLGCGITTDCGSCATGNWCSSGYCCANGSHYDTSSNTCMSDTPPPPPNCPTNKPYCDATGTCATPAACKRAGGGGNCHGTTCS